MRRQGVCCFRGNKVAVYKWHHSVSIPSFIRLLCSASYQLCQSWLLAMSQAKLVQRNHCAHNYGKTGKARCSHVTSLPKLCSHLWAKHSHSVCTCPHEQGWGRGDEECLKSSQWISHIIFAWIALPYIKIDLYTAAKSCVTSDFSLHDYYVTRCIDITSIKF